MFWMQVLNWIGNHAGFLEKTMQAVLDKYNYGHVDALVCFVIALERHPCLCEARVVQWKLKILLVAAKAFLTKLCLCVFVP